MTAHDISKAIIPAAGLGTRMLPAAKAVPKELLPILDRPTIQYVVEEAVQAGVDDVLLITSRQKQAIEDHFNRNPVLEARLAEKGRQSLLASIEQLIQKVRICSVHQSRQLGLGDAVYQARRHVSSGPFLCLLGDAVFSGDLLPATQLLAAHRNLGGSIIGVEEVELERVGRYGIIAGKAVADGAIRIETLIEKPPPEAAPSRMAIAARYLLTPAIFDCIEKTAPGAGGEVQLTDALRLLLDREPVHAVVLRARRHDIGNGIDWLKTNLIYARRDPQVWKEMEPLLRELLE